MLAGLEPLQELASHSINSAGSCICSYTVNVMSLSSCPSGCNTCHPPALLSLLIQDSAAVQLYACGQAYDYGMGLWHQFVRGDVHRHVCQR